MARDLGSGEREDINDENGVLEITPMKENAMKRFPILLVLAAVAWGTFSYADFAGSGFSGPPFTHGTLTDTKWCIYTAGTGIVCNSDEPAGTGTVTGPASATEDNVVTWGGNNVTLKDGGVALSALARLASPTFTGTVTFPTWFMLGTDNVSLNQNLRTTDSPTFVSVTAGSYVSNAADNTRGWTALNTAAPTGADLTAGKCWTLKGATSATDLLQCRNSDNTATNNMGAVVKTFSFAIDNVIANDNVLLVRTPRAWTLTRADCGLSGVAPDNVVGQIMECATDNTDSCTTLDAWSVVYSAGTPFSDTSMTDGDVAAGAWIRWSTTSVGTTNSNKLSCTIQYTE